MRVSVGEPTVHPFPIRPRPRCRHPAPQIEPETLHPEFDDEPWESQIERASVPLPLFVPRDQVLFEQLEPRRFLQIELEQIACAAWLRKRWSFKTREKALP